MVLRILFLAFQRFQRFQQLQLFPQAMLQIARQLLISALLHVQ
jgi:hypothetical protein